MNYIPFSHPDLPWARKGFYYNNYKFYLEDKFGERVQRISIEGGFTCPNRDGTKGQGGCNYCNNESFAPSYARKDKTVKQQIEDGKKYLSKRFQTDKYIAYFQSYSNTYDKLSTLKSLYESAIEDPDIVGLSVSTRADCISIEILDLLADLSEKIYINLEIGIEIIHLFRVTSHCIDFPLIQVIFLRLHL